MSKEIGGENILEMNNPMNDRPDLPVLESVETSTASILPLIIMMSMYILFIVPIAVIALLYFRQFILVRGLVVIFLIFALTAWLIIRSLFGFFSYKTDSIGILLRGPLRRKYISWIEIKEAYTKDATAEKIITLVTNNGVFQLAPRSVGGLSGEVLIASIWQRLRRLGRAEKITIPNRAQTLWDAIPDELQRQQDWRRQSILGDVIGLVIFVLMFWGYPIYLYIVHPIDRVMAGILIVLVAVISAFIIPTLTRKPKQISLRDDCIDASLMFKSVRLFWDDITYAYWNKEGLIIGSKPKRVEVRVPWMKKAVTSSKLILAIIRRLRTSAHPQAITIPDALRYFESEVTPSGVQVETSAELKLSKPEKRLIIWGVGGLLSLCTLTGLLRQPPEISTTSIFAGITVLWLTLAGRILNAYSQNVDSQGYTKTYIGKIRQFVSWDKVARFEESLAKSYLIRLKNDKGKTLAEVNVGYGPNEDRARFITTLRSRMDTLSGEDTRWLARPWKPGD